MSYHTFPASLPFVASLHDQVLLDEVIDQISREKTVTIEEPSTPEPHPHPFMDALKAYSNMQKTVNGANAYRSTLDSCLDLFNSIGSGAPATRVRFLLDKAWQQDPLATLRIIFHARSIHCGKSENTQFYIGFGWLLQHHPKTAILNLHILVDGTVPAKSAKAKDERNDEWDMMEDIEPSVHFKSHGYWKDLLCIAKIYVAGELDGPKRLDCKYRSLNCPKETKKDPNKLEKRLNARKKFYEQVNKMSEENKVIELEKHRKMIAAREDNRAVKRREEKLKKRRERHARVSALLTEDPCYQALHCTVARLFAHQLQLDLKQLQANKMQDNKGRHAIANNISLAAKWAPSLAHSHDKTTLLATSIAEVLFPPEAYQDTDESREHYLNKVRQLYRKVYISPLREALEVTERLMSLKQWHKIDFSHVSSKSMRVNRMQFYKHCRESFAKYLQGVVLGERSISGATLKPHELVKAAVKLNNDPENPVEKEMASLERDLVNSQWKTLVNSITSEQGQTLGECLAICDQSASMTYGYGNVIPMWSALGLGLILAALAKPPFAGTVISFADEPVVVNVDPNSPLTEQVRAVQNAPVGYSTNLEAVFLDLLLPIAKKNNLRPEDMVKRLYIFSDMEFNEGTGSANWDTLYEHIEKKYKAAGYNMPEIVWWNLAGQRPTSSPEFSDEAPLQATKHTKGCAMLCGYSASMLKSFLEGEAVQSENDGTKVLDPIRTMVDAISHESFSGLVLYD